MNGCLLAGVIQRLPKNDDGSVNYEDICEIFGETCEKGPAAASSVSNDGFPVPEEKSFVRAL